jgi:hypothetical protein
MSLPDDDFLSFNIFSLIYINYLLVVDVDEVFSSSPEDLPPVGVSSRNIDSLA